jgi:RNA polymerase sigma-70 factor (ECF subfamily)
MQQKLGPVLSQPNVQFDRIYREEAGRITAALVRILGDFGLAEDAVQDALLAALEHWPVDGVPSSPGAWLFTVARRKAFDQLRKRARHQEKLMQLEWPEVQEPDDRLRLIFTCCHPAIAREGQLALTLRAVCGLTTAEIARAFLTSEATVAKRILRAKQKIVQAHIPFQTPAAEDLEERLQEVLSVLYLMFNEGYLSTGGAQPARPDLAEDAAWLAALLVGWLPEQPEPKGLLALMRLHLARAASRFTSAGDIIVLKDQDRSLWNQEMIREARSLLDAAATAERPGPYQLQAAIVACHAQAASYEATDWPRVVALYDLLLELAPSPVIRLNRAVALHEIAGPQSALAAIEPLAEDLNGYHLFHAVRAEMLRATGQFDLAKSEARQALALTDNVAERALLERRLRDTLPETR